MHTSVYLAATLVLGISVAGCGSKAKDDANAKPSGSVGASANAAPADPNTIAVNEKGIFLGGTRLGDAPADASSDIKPLLDKLKARTDAATAALTLELGANTTCRAAMSVYATAASAGFTKLTFKQGATSFAVPPSPAKQPTDEQLRADGGSREVFAVFKSDGNVEFKPFRCGGAFDVVPVAGFPALAKEWCKDHPDCLRSVRVRCDAAMPMSNVLSALEAIRKDATKLQLGSADECKADEGPVEYMSAQANGAPAANTKPAPKNPPVAVIREGAVTVVGGLAEAEIRELVKTKLDAMKTCYEAGLGRNPALEGRLSVAFSIGKKGALMQVQNKSTDIPDIEVVNCALGAFATLTFPAKGSITSVNYPILMTVK